MNTARQPASSAHTGLSDAFYPHRRSTLRFRLDLVLLIALVGVVIVPIWSFKYFPSTDGGAHVASADVLLKYFRADGAPYREFFELTRLPVPNSAGHFTLAGLMLFL